MQKEEKAGCPSFARVVFWRRVNPFTKYLAMFVNLVLKDLSIDFHPGVLLPNSLNAKSLRHATHFGSLTRYVGGSLVVETIFPSFFLTIILEYCICARIVSAWLAVGENSWLMKPIVILGGGRKQCICKVSTTVTDSKIQIDTVSSSIYHGSSSWGNDKQSQNNLFSSTFPVNIYKLHLWTGTRSVATSASSLPPNNKTTRLTPRHSFGRLNL